jgi:SAM-dependent methyltransferase
MTDCPSCESRDVQRIGSLPASRWIAGRELEQPVTGGTLWRCRICALLFRAPIDYLDRLEDLYENDVTNFWSQNDQRDDWSAVREFAHRRFASATSVLDFGCYTGDLLAQFEPRFERMAIEPNRAAALVARERHGIETWPHLDDLPAGRRFDLIIACDTVEHFRNPLDLLVRLASLLTSSGVLVVTTGNADCRLWTWAGANWWYCSYPEHLAFIGPRWLEHMAGTGRIRIETYRTFARRSLGIGRRLFDSVCCVGYALAPTLYLWAEAGAKRLVGRRSAPDVRGAGLGDDHIFVALGAMPADAA